MAGRGSALGSCPNQADAGAAGLPCSATGGWVSVEAPGCASEPPAASFLFRPRRAGRPCPWISSQVKLNWPTRDCTCSSAFRRDSSARRASVAAACSMTARSCSSDAASRFSIPAKPVILTLHSSGAPYFTADRRARSMLLRKTRKSPSFPPRLASSAAIPCRYVIQLRSFATGQRAPPAEMRCWAGSR